jgi:cytochrome c oxidase assembly protein subunit 15
MVAYAILIVALVHAFDVERSVDSARVRIGAFAVFAAVALQVALGIATLLWHVPLPLALSHQAVAMLVLTIAALHAADVTRHSGARLKAASPESIIATSADMDSRFDVARRSGMTPRDVNPPAPARGRR